MAKIAGCWAGCHGVRDRGGVEEIPGIRRVTAPPPGAVIPDYSDAELVRLISHGVKRDGRSAIGMSSYTEAAHGLLLGPENTIILVEQFSHTLDLKRTVTATTLPMRIRTKISFVASLLMASSMVLAEAPEPSPVVVEVRIVTENSSRSQTSIFAIEAGVEKLFGNKFPKLKVLMLPEERDQFPFQIRLIAESGQILSSTVVYYTPEFAAEFSLDATGIEARGRISALPR